MSPLETLARENYGDLSAAETTLIANAGRTSLTVCGLNDDLNDPTNDPRNADAWPVHRIIRGELISWLCTERLAKPFISQSGLHILGAKITGAIALVSVSVEFPLVFACCKFDDEINLQAARTRTLSFLQTHLKSVLADGAVIGGAFFFRESLASQLQFAGSRIDGQFDCDGSSFDKLILDGATVAVGVLLRRTAGQVKLSRTRIGADLDCGGASFATTVGSPDPAMDAGGVHVDGSVFLRKQFWAQGLVRLSGAVIGSNLECTEAKFMPGHARVADGAALRADSVCVQGSVLLSDGFRSDGDVTFISSRIQGDFNCTKSEFRSGLALERAEVKGTLFWRSVTLLEESRLDLIQTSVGSLGDDKQSWPSRGNLQLYGFTYAQISLKSPNTVNERLDWLSRQDAFSRQPYRQMSKILREQGNDAGARKVLYAMESQSENSGRRPFRGRISSFALRHVIGYGYHPFWALWWFLGIVVFGWLFFCLGFRAGSIVPTDGHAYAVFAQNRSLPDNYVRFQGFFYSLENSFPLVRLGQADAWQPDPGPALDATVKESRIVSFLRPVLRPRCLRAIRYAQILSGWVLTTMWIAGLAGLVRKD